MKTQYDDKQWGVNDFKRYHSGTMPAAERHALEKAALDDPFLDDALEGYGFSTQPEENLAQLRLQINKADDKKNARVIWYKHPGFSKVYKVAAALVLFAGLAWLFYPKQGEKPVELASNANPAPSPDTASIPLLQTTLDTTTTVQLPGIYDAEQPPPVLASAPRPKEKVVTKARVKVDDVNTRVEVEDALLLARNSESSKEESKKLESDLSFARRSMEASMPANANVITGRVVTAQGQPVPYAVISVPSLNSNLAADANGNFVLPNSTNLQVVQADVNAVGFEKSNTALSANNSNNKIVLQESGNALSEVVVMGYGTTKKSAPPVAAAPEKMKSAANADYPVILKNGKPLESWEAFNEFVSNQMKTNKFLDTTGVVVLSFDLDKNGTAQNISVVKKLCDSCDEAAKKILRNAPAMKRVKQGKKVEAVIRF